VTVVELPPEPERPRPVVSSDEDFFG